MEDLKEEEVIESILPGESQGFLFDYFLNGLFGEEKAFTKGLTSSDYDIILSTDEAEDSEIFHSLNICNTKFDPSTAPSKKVIIFEDLEAVVQPFIDGKNLAEQDFKEVTLHVYPKIRRNLRFDISLLKYKIVRMSRNGPEIKDYKMEHINDNPDKKDILCICSFKLNGKKHKFEKILQLLEQFKEFEYFWNFHRIAYIIFCIKKERQILEEFNMFPEKMKYVNDSYTNVRLLFFVEPQGKDNNELLNVYEFNDLGKNYYFHMNSDNIIYKADDMLLSGDIIKNSLKRKGDELYEKGLSFKSKEQLLKERNEAFLTFFNFLKNIKQYKYALYIGFKFDICIRYDENFNFKISYIDFSHIIGELRTKEYNIIKRCADILKPDHVDLEEIPTVDIYVDFSDKKCFRCASQISDNQDMHYCYECKKKWCRKCVLNNYRMNTGQAKYIDYQHNVLYFKTRDLSKFKDIDKKKFEIDKNSTDDEKKVQDIVICKGCNQKNDNVLNYLCLNCKPGKATSEEYFYYCDNCIQEMMKNTEKGKKIQELEERIYSEETRILYNEKETYRHENENHIYLMISFRNNYNVPLNYNYDYNYNF